MLTDRQKHCLQGIGIRVWQTRSHTEPTAEITQSVQPRAAAETVTEAIREKPVTPVTATTTEPKQAFDLNDWAGTLQSIESCTNCELSKSCTRKVPGKGFQQADLMIIGEAPGHEEDRQGKPFVGRAGQLLDRMLQAIGVAPDQVYITNILKCRPPNNRDPKAEEVSACAQFLQAQIQLIQPKVIFSVGRVSAQNLLNNQAPVGRLRGQRFTLPHTDIPLLVTYHPAYLLRNPAEKAKVWQDLKALHTLLDSPGTDDSGTA